MQMQIAMLKGGQPYLTPLLISKEFESKPNRDNLTSKLLHMISAQFTEYWENSKAFKKISRSTLLMLFAKLGFTGRSGKIHLQMIARMHWKCVIQHVEMPSISLTFWTLSFYLGQCQRKPWPQDKQCTLLASAGKWACFEHPLTKRGREIKHRRK